MYDHALGKEVRHSEIDRCPECFQDIFDFGVCQCRKREHYIHLRQEMREALKMLTIKLNKAA